jgi:hypothetical protein
MRTTDHRRGDRVDTLAVEDVVTEPPTNRAKAFAPRHKHSYEKR